MSDYRVTTIGEILEQLPELTDPVRAGNGDGQTWLRLMPHEPSCRIRDWKPPRCTCAYSSAAEVVRLLQVMRDDRVHFVTMPAGGTVTLHRLWWNLNERYLRATTSTRELGWRQGQFAGLASYQTVVAQPNGWQLALAKERTRRKQAHTLIRVRVATWSPNVDRAQVARGIGWMADNWAGLEEPRLPKMEKAA